jgi:hypothetical protein
MDLGMRGTATIRDSLPFHPMDLRVRSAAGRDSVPGIKSIIIQLREPKRL